MEISFKRNYNESYMVVEGKPEINAFEEKMLKNNQISCLLPFYTMQVNDISQYWYRITAKESLRDFLDHNALTLELIEKVFFYILAACEEVDKFVISQEHILISPENIFFERKNNEFVVYLCYCPFPLGPFIDQFRSVTELLMTLTEPDNELLNQTCYDLYDMSMQDDMSLKEMLDFVRTKRTSEANIVVEKVTLADREPDREFSEYTNTVDRYSKGYNYAAEEEYDEDYYDDYKEEYEENDGGGTSKKSGFFASLFKKTNKDGKTGKVSKKTRHFKKKRGVESIDDEEMERRSFDFEVSPDEELYTPTVLLNDCNNLCAGKLVHSGGFGEDYLIDKDIFRIGSAKDKNEAIIRSKAVSRHHARISREGNDYYLEDLNSTNGTFLNGEILSYSKKIKLKAMDKITFADIAYTFM